MRWTRVGSEGHGHGLLSFSTSSVEALGFVRPLQDSMGYYCANTHRGKAEKWEVSCSKVKLERDCMI